MSQQFVHFVGENTRFRNNAHNITQRHAQCNIHVDSLIETSVAGETMNPKSRFCFTVVSFVVICVFSELAVLTRNSAFAQDADSAELIAQLDQSAKELPETFVHDFSIDGVPPDLFPGPAKNATSHGVPMVLQTKGPWGGKSIFAQLQLEGDFDIEVEYDRFKTDGDMNSTVLLSAHFDDAAKSSFRVIRIRHPSGNQHAEVSHSQLVDGKRIYKTSAVVPREETQGRLRLSRRGNDLHHLVATLDGEWLLLATNKVAAATTLPKGISLEIGGNGQTRTSVVWKRLSVKANSIRDPRRIVARLNSELPKLKSVFRHDFSDDGFGDNFFTAPTAVKNDIEAVELGLRTSARGKGEGKWGSTEVSTAFEIQGDFDIEAEFHRLQLGGEEQSCIMLTAKLGDEIQRTCRATRMRYGSQREVVRGSLITFVDGKRKFESPDIADNDSTGGRLRLSRRGEELYVLYADSDSSEYHLVSTRKGSTANVNAKGVVLRTTAIGSATAQVIWKSLTISAEKLLHHPANVPSRQLAVMNSDGSDVKLLTGPPEYLSHLGSPEWSRDGKRIVFDASLGGTDTSQIIVMNEDGTDMEDLGPGCMPSFAAEDEEIVFTEQGFGIIRMNSDGTGRAQLEESGWGSHGSPDGRRVAWALGNNITVLNLDTDERFQLLKKGQSGRLRQIYWNMSWSNDSKSMAFRARTRQNQEIIAMADAAAESGFKVLFTGKINGDVSWKPDGSAVLFSRLDSATKIRSMFTVDVQPPHQVRPVLGPPVEWKVFDCDWSPDGKKIVFSATIPTKPITWPPR